MLAGRTCTGWGSFSGIAGLNVFHPELQHPLLGRRSLSTSGLLFLICLGSFTIGLCALKVFVAEVAAVELRSAGITQSCGTSWEPRGPAQKLVPSLFTALASCVGSVWGERRISTFKNSEQSSK